MFQVHGLELRGKAIDVPGVLTAQVLLPEGWTDKPVQVEPRGRLPDDDKEYVVVSTLPEEPTPFIDLYIDNRGSDASEFLVGQMKLPLKPNSTDQVGVHFVPEREDAAKLRINDAILGTLPTASGLRESPQFLVDVSGKRKYRLSCVSYGPQLCSSQPRILKGQHLYQVLRIDSFLRRAPATGAMGTSIELLDVTDMK